MATIEKWWGVVKDKRVFHLLKQAICASVSQCDVRALVRGECSKHWWCDVRGIASIGETWIMYLCRNIH